MWSGWSPTKPTTSSIQQHRHRRWDPLTPVVEHKRVVLELLIQHPCNVVPPGLRATIAPALQVAEWLDEGPLLRHRSSSNGCCRKAFLPGRVSVQIDPQADEKTFPIPTQGSLCEPHNGAGWASVQIGRLCDWILGFLPAAEFFTCVDYMPSSLFIRLGYFVLDDSDVNDSWMPSVTQAIECQEHVGRHMFVQSRP